MEFEASLTGNAKKPIFSYMLNLSIWHGFEDWGQKWRISLLASRSMQSERRVGVLEPSAGAVASRPRKAGDILTTHYEGVELVSGLSDACVRRDDVGTRPVASESGECNEWVCFCAHCSSNQLPYDICSNRRRRRRRQLRSWQRNAQNKADDRRGGDAERWYPRAARQTSPVHTNKARIRLWTVIQVLDEPAADSLQLFWVLRLSWRWAESNMMSRSSEVNDVFEKVQSECDRSLPVALWSKVE